MNTEERKNHTSKEVKSQGGEQTPDSSFNTIKEWIDHIPGHRILEAYEGNTTIRGTFDFIWLQGTVISPLLWCLVIKDLMVELTKMKCLVIGQARTY